MPGPCLGVEGRVSCARSIEPGTFGCGMFECLGQKVVLTDVQGVRFSSIAALYLLEQ